MNLLDRLLGHDAWTTRQLLDICATLSDEQLDQEHDIGHRTLRATFDHIIFNMEGWSAPMAGQPFQRQTDRSIPGLIARLEAAAALLALVARRVADADDWDATYIDDLSDPPRERKFGTAIAHVITHSMHHRAHLLYMLRLTGVESVPEGDVFSWENRLAG